jgi:hypothetical protein
MYCVCAGEARSQEKQGSWLQTWACLARNFELAIITADRLLLPKSADVLKTGI